MHVVRRSEMENSGPVPGLTEYALGARAGAQGVWLARILAAPGVGVSPVHHHRESEALVCILSGTMTFIHGPYLRDRVDLNEGDFLFIPAWEVHAEANLGPEPVDMVMARSTPTPIMDVQSDSQVPQELLTALPSVLPSIS